LANISGSSYDDVLGVHFLPGASVHVELLSWNNWCNCSRTLSQRTCHCSLRHYSRFAARPLLHLPPHLTKHIRFSASHTRCLWACPGSRKHCRYWSED